jgi:hypothetical protein
LDLKQIEFSLQGQQIIHPKCDGSCCQRTEKCDGFLVDPGKAIYWIEGKALTSKEVESNNCKVTMQLVLVLCILNQHPISFI